jgi:arsenate reductase
MAGQASKGVEEYLGKVVFAHTITVCGDAEENCPTVFLNMGRHEHWPFDDPARMQGSDPERLDAVRTVRDAISARVMLWLEEQNIQPKLP